MSSQPSPGRPPQGGGDPWSAFGYLVAGIGLYGLIGWGLGVWLHASYLTPVGILIGAALGLVLVFHQFGRVPGPGGTAPSTTRPNTGRPSSTKPSTDSSSTEQPPPQPDEPSGEAADRGETE